MGGGGGLSLNPVSSVSFFAGAQKDAGWSQGLVGDIS